MSAEINSPPWNFQTIWPSGAAGRQRDAYLLEKARLWSGSNRCFEFMRTRLLTLDDGWHITTAGSC